MEAKFTASPATFEKIKNFLEELYRITKHDYVFVSFTTLSDKYKLHSIISKILIENKVVIRKKIKGASGFHYRWIGAPYEPIMAKTLSNNYITTRNNVANELIKRKKNMLIIASQNKGVEGVQRNSQIPVLPKEEKPILNQSNGEDFFAIESRGNRFEALLINKEWEVGTMISGSIITWNLGTQKKAEVFEFIDKIKITS